MISRSSTRISTVLVDPRVHLGQEEQVLVVVARVGVVVGAGRPGGGPHDDRPDQPHLHLQLGVGAAVVV